MGKIVFGRVPGFSLPAGQVEIREPVEDSPRLQRQRLRRRPDVGACADAYGDAVKF